jgi:hypothetical protein
VGIPASSVTFTDQVNVPASLKMAVRIFSKIVLSLGSLHLTLMAVIGIWFWSSPARFEAQQHGHIDPLGLECTSMSLMGNKIDLSSSPLRIVSLVIYAFFAIPGLNLLVPAALFLALHVVYHHFRPRKEKAEPSVVPVYVSLMFLLAVNIVFMVDIETTITLHEVTDESNWTFGQTLAVLLLVLPLRDVFDFVMRVRHNKRRDRCTQELKDALNASDMNTVKRVVKYANIQEEARGML